MLKQDPNLPSLDMAWSRRRMTDLFNHRVLFGQQVTSVKRVRVAYSPGRQCAVLYSLQLVDDPKAPSPWAVVTFARNDSLGRVYSRDYGNGAGASSDQAPDSAAYFPEF